MVELEKRGIPTVSWVVESFVKDAKFSSDVFGSKDIALAVVPQDTFFESKDHIRKLVANSIDQIIDGLTKPRGTTSPTPEPSESIVISGSDLLDAADKMNRKFLDEGWSDGFPIVPPTSQAVDSMLENTHRRREEVIGVIDPGCGIATVEKIAINAVMAGCKPKHLPVLIAAVRCLADPALNLRTFVPSTGAQGPFTLINGPIAKKLNINSKGSALDPGSQSHANIVIGRAISLIIMNIGQGYPGILSMSTIGSPLNYSCCVAENEEDSPWESYHVEKGYDKNTSTVSVMFIRGSTTYGDFLSNTAESIARGQSWIASRANVTSGLWLVDRKNVHRSLFLVNPAHARTLAREGWNKKRLREYIYHHAKLPLQALMFGKDPEIVIREHPQFATLLEEHPEIPVPVQATPEAFEIAVVGGPGPCSSYFEGFGDTITVPIED